MDDEMRVSSLHTCPRCGEGISYGPPGTIAYNCSKCRIEIYYEMDTKEAKKDARRERAEKLRKARRADPYENGTVPPWLKWLDGI